ncbi:MAG: tRNA uridine-5-carboxymethylaminomethyl(34) synthesis GTPase MnmE [Gemmataceae bacterium]
MTGPAIPHLDDTIVAVSSAPGPGPRAIVRLSGPATATIVASVFHEHQSPLTTQSTRRKSGNLTLTGVTSRLPCDLFFWKSPRTYTGQDLAELHTISSPPLVERLVADLLAAGARSARPGEFTMRAFLAGKKDLPQAEAVLAVIDARSDADLRGALGQLAGGVSRPLDQLRDDLLNLLADVEAGLDFVEEDIQFVTASEILNRIDSALDQLNALHRQLDERSENGRLIRIALVGQPNAGKSSLFNALVGTSSALVSPTSGTTRDYLTQRMAWPGCEFELIDTAGWSHATDGIDVQAQRLAAEQSERADLLLWCLPTNERVPKADRQRLQSLGCDIQLVRTKADLASQESNRSEDANTGIPVSTRTHAGMNELKQVITERVQSLSRPALAPSLSRCRHHVESASASLSRGKRIIEQHEPAELFALELRAALEQIGEMTGAIYTNDLLDRVFGRFCIGK